ncbi:hypothetical protein JDV02_009284 [Purpureocillium takamizusanense]|uniref:Uncharacterized protein n=1 Tax=Purpureocillium takamizusanense TaxID=2060973 RepID=A0A9Q8VFI1_9HYPO|nr:uncharacterized protein JDV02_009284 [Purpureocillium takamizusanense]UNI23466.1 hypothetical protein JDV02_009284 [Purpureocillium takamizusanense]
MSPHNFPFMAVKHDVHPHEFSRALLRKQQQSRNGTCVPTSGASSVRSQGGCIIHPLYVVLCAGQVSDSHTHAYQIWAAAVPRLISTTPAKSATGHHAKAAVLSALNLVLGEYPLDGLWVRSRPTNRRSPAHWQFVKGGTLTLMTALSTKLGLAAGPPPRPRWAKAQHWHQGTAARLLSSLQTYLAPPVRVMAVRYPFTMRPSTSTLAAILGGRFHRLPSFPSPRRRAQGSRRPRAVGPDVCHPPETNRVDCAALRRPTRACCRGSIELANGQDDEKRHGKTRKACVRRHRMSTAGERQSVLDPASLAGRIRQRDSSEQENAPATSSTRPWP